ncbi:hypothetical protein R69927_07794 [Paraburkholderia domus]|jgi:hypothetical protein|uniref:Immunity protein 52 domain-containing protein n=1 Tax=Paraburkholderia domus TaxID=2793075 RepID=A0A9N8N9W3_9BURK|nr:Imm52 family immunity protein [Paraburkholderia domus]MBK5054655.1 immunity 52 family protein [Burkholderia sp. R-70006]MBK5066461.1 immunity 52 family protein [Burkholderia sp. R-70199]MBK5091812.1 immunity 52 family protein [Burkholderia sp. R-69927]MBK5125884.1 immunity 52 family protein [Burkholderia sp. R-69980]MBK5170110.1 immunity 52 family protein [Burkholderia sp. R-70211]
MNILVFFYVEPTVVEFEEGYARLERLIEGLKPSIPNVEWYVSPSNQQESKQIWPAFSDKQRFLRRLRSDRDESIKAWSGYPGGFSVLLTSAKDEEAFGKPKGRCLLDFAPDRGRIRLEVVRPDEAWPDIDLSEWTKGVLSAVATVELVQFANVDVDAKKKTGKGSISFRFDHRTFPHRQFLGWMGFVPKLVKPGDLPQAAEVIPMPDRHGTLVVAVGELFDVHNPRHIQQAQQVEMRLVDLDALPVIDDSLL